MNSYLRKKSHISFSIKKLCDSIIMSLLTITGNYLANINFQSKRCILYRVCEAVESCMAGTAVCVSSGRGARTRFQCRRAADPGQPGGYPEPSALPPFPDLRNRITQLARSRSVYRSRTDVRGRRLERRSRTPGRRRKGLLAPWGGVASIDRRQLQETSVRPILKDPQGAVRPLLDLANALSPLEPLFFLGAVTGEFDSN